MTRLKVLLIGPGGVGSVVALALDRSQQCEVTVVARSSYDILSQEGFNFDSINYGKIERWRPHKVMRTIEDASLHKPYDYIVVCTKCVPEVYKTEDLIRPVVTPGAAVVIIQNGIGNEQPIMDAFPESYVIGVVTSVGATNHGGHITHKISDKMVVGTMDPRIEAVNSAKRFVEVYNSSQSEAEFSSDLGYRRWWKLFYNATFNTTGALTGNDTSRIFFSGLKDSIVAPGMLELRKIAEAELGLEIDPDVEKYWLDVSRGKYYEPSMLVDVKKGRVMELEVILGNPLRIAAKHHVDAPILSMLYMALRGVQFSLLEKNGVISLPTEPFDRSLAKAIDF